jgi:hypothetical protein
MKPDLKVVETIYPTNASNIADMLAQASDSIRAETEDDDRTEAIVAVQLTESGAVKVYGWGATDSVKAIGTLHLGIHDLANAMLQEDL